MSIGVQFSNLEYHLHSSKGANQTMSSMEKIAASAPKLLPVVLPVIEESAPVILEGAATVAGGVLSVLASPVVLTGVGLWGAYRIAKKLF